MPLNRRNLTILVVFFALLGIASITLYGNIPCAVICLVMLIVTGIMLIRRVKSPDLSSRTGASPAADAADHRPDTDG